MKYVFARFDAGDRVLQSSAAVLFCDIRSFTTISETYEAWEIVEMLNGYFSVWQPIVEKYGGIIDRFIGDAISVVFLEEMHPDYISRAVSVANEVMIEVQTFNRERFARGEFTIKNGIGIAVSDVDLTILGNEEKRDFFLHGRAVEVSEELEAESKRGVFSKIIVDEQTWMATSSSFQFEDFDSEVYPSEAFYELVHDELDLTSSTQDEESYQNITL